MKTKIQTLCEQAILKAESTNTILKLVRISTKKTSEILLAVKNK